VYSLSFSETNPWRVVTKEH